MLFLIPILYGLGREKCKAKAAIGDFREFVAKTNEKIQKEENEEVIAKENKGKMKRIVDFCKCIRNCFCCLCDLVRSGRLIPSNKRVRILLTLLALFFMMQMIGSLFYFVLALKFSAQSKMTGLFVGIGIESVMFLILLSRYLRVIFFVTVPSLIGSRLRTIIVILMLIWAFQFPARNVTSNIESAMEGVNCVSQRVKDVVEEVKERAGNNFRDEPIEKIQEFMRDQAKPLKQIQETVRNLDESLDNMMAWQRGLIDKIHNLMQNCSVLAHLPFQACVGWLSEQQSACQDRFFEAICKPIDLVKGLCYLTKVIHIGCEWPARVKGSIKEGVNSFVRGAKDKASELAKKTFIYKIFNETKELNITIDHEKNYTEEFIVDKERIHKELRQEIQGFERSMDLIIFVLDILMIILTVWPLLMSILYVINFKRNDSTDNHYIDGQFESIDKARALNGQMTLLPLIPKERKQYIRTSSFRTTGKEKLLMCIQHVLLFYSILPIAIFILVDIFVYKLMRKAFVFFHGNNTIFTVPSIYTIKVSGDGILNKLLGGILHTFEPLTDSKQRDEMWRQCFEEPTPPNYALFQIIFLLYILCASLIFVQNYLKRTRHLIALHFFPERHRPRALFLYDKILKKRMQIWDMMVDIEKSKVEDDSEEKARQLLLYKGLPVLCEEKQRCFRCARADLTPKEISNIRLCVRCRAVYCVDCYTVRQRCLSRTCRAPLQQIVEDVEFYVDSSCEENEEEDETQQSEEEFIGDNEEEDIDTASKYVEEEEAKRWQKMFPPFKPESSHFFDPVEYKQGPSHSR